ncbi:Interactor protein for cytohesin exchange factors 1 [Microtus ochrogaster]|uniref:Interactor protein for cytohesin exchange factors 1 n=1 Tax=Microtus ochrogaster TaxID=79684 RepID=A0A8J6KUI1_MICOH|nr:Interactor protein for cytohesin exchange factors 1 [Microtus ochrogaster]
MEPLAESDMPKLCCAFKINHPEIKTFYFAAENLQEMNISLGIIHIRQNRASPSSYRVHSFMHRWLSKLGFAVIHQESTTKDEECYSESEQEDPEIASETPPPPYASATSSPVVRVDVARRASSSSPKLRGSSCSFSSLETTGKVPSRVSSSGSKERQSWLDIVNNVPAADDAGHPLTLTVQVHTPSEASNCLAPENSSVTAESGFLNSLSSDDTSSLSNNQNHLTVPDRAAGSRMVDREETKVSEDDEMEKLYKSLEQASLSPLGDRRPSTKKELRKSFVKRCKNPSVNEKLHKIRTLNSTLKCKEHDLAMINQLLDDPKLTARKYREWKVMNTLLIQDIYHQQQQVPQDPEDTPQELKNPSSSDCVEKSL